MPPPSSTSEPTDPRERAREVLRRAGLKSTQPRLAVLELLAEAAAALSHREISERLSESFLNKATIFRVLVDLCDANILRRFDLGDHAWRFELVNADCDVHAHLLCDVCGEVICLSDVSASDAAERILPTNSPHQAREIVIKGLCAACQPQRNFS